MANLKAAMLNQPRPHLHKAAAGTIPCDMCFGQAVIRRHTPDLEKFLNIRPRWDQMISIRKGKESFAYPQNPFVEYPRGPPKELPELPKKKPKIRGLEGRSLDEVILPYIDDSDTSEDEEMIDREKNLKTRQQKMFLNHIWKKNRNK